MKIIHLLRHYDILPTSFKLHDQLKLLVIVHGLVLGIGFRLDRNVFKNVFGSRVLPAAGGFVSLARPRDMGIASRPRSSKS